MMPGSWMEDRDDATGTQPPGVEEMNRILTTKTGWLALATVLACLTMMVGVAFAVPTASHGTQMDADQDGSGPMTANDWDWTQMNTDGHRYGKGHGSECSCSYSYSCSCSCRHPHGTQMDADHGGLRPKTTD